MVREIWIVLVGAIILVGCGSVVTDEPDAGVDLEELEKVDEALGLSRENAARDCLSLKLQKPDVPSGLYWIDPDDDGGVADAWQAWCDMKRDGGGWTLVLQNNQSVASEQRLTWKQSTEQIEIVGGQLGDDLSAFDLHVGLIEWAQLGRQARLEMGDAVEQPLRQAFSTLTLDSANEYELQLTDQDVRLGTRPGFFITHNGKKFSASDQDNDNGIDKDGNEVSCANLYTHPWWYDTCWSGSIWGFGSGKNSGAFWVGSRPTEEQYLWGALWLRRADGK